jgi:predicted XRE-type DNA-binding protein
MNNSKKKKKKLELTKKEKEKLKRNIEIYMTIKGVKQPEIAENLSITSVSFSLKKNGFNDFTFTEFKRMAKFLNVSLDVLAGLEEVAV